MCPGKTCAAAVLCMVATTAMQDSALLVDGHHRRRGGMCAGVTGERPQSAREGVPEAADAAMQAVEVARSGAVSSDQIDLKALAAAWSVANATLDARLSGVAMCILSDRSVEVVADGSRTRADVKWLLEALMAL